MLVDAASVCRTWEVFGSSCIPNCPAPYPAGLGDGVLQPGVGQVREVQHHTYVEQGVNGGLMLSRGARQRAMGEQVRYVKRAKAARELAISLSNLDR